MGSPIAETARSKEIGPGWAARTYGVRDWDKLPHETWNPVTQTEPDAREPQVNWILVFVPSIYKEEPRGRRTR